MVANYLFFSLPPPCIIVFVTFISAMLGQWTVIKTPSFFINRILDACNICSSFVFVVFDGITEIISECLGGGGKCQFLITFIHLAIALVHPLLSFMYGFLLRESHLEGKSQGLDH